ncbi:MAG: sigma-54 dependent transcriptional regulator, acetoin dehydrogenase operon transcriptional [Paraburkholderia sp.]|jgi:transcriptional regulator of acetoin/glycerol metabolism|uniref:sigma-54-dependent Fis family transcriptional regulator n=1 Tax=Paraburkholderia sp. TaxID=1926495 RepID=UPI002AFF31E3|nr:sigma-54-dependent Fis family transcriptional regulator [Paraburkholderia sp.]MEA3087341.1 sigma-54 dependent transcriptional regulator, acetoin dehydrogenase operon transcriptional [Paraburkholderia sp.]
MSLLADSNTHVREVLNVVNHQLTTRPTSESVAQSWARCINEFQLDPSRFVTPPVLTQYELSARREALGDLIACSKLEMTTLYQQLADPELAVVLVDSGGVIIHQVSSVPFAEAVADDGFRVGALWSEREAGTNGMGTCLAERDCIAVCQHEHFYPRYTSLTCSAAPIFDDSGEIAGVLDVTSRSKLLQQHSLVLVGMSRQMIENRLLDARYRHANMIHFHSRPEFVGTLHGGKLAVADDSTVLAANRSALFQLGFRSLSELRGRRIDEAFNASLEDMIARSIRGSFHPVTVYSANATNRFFLVAQTPQNSAGRATRVLVTDPAARSSKAPDKRAASPKLDEIAHLEFGDPRMASQIQLAARVIQRKIPIVLRGQTGTGKEVFAQALHSISPHADGPFVPVNCASLPENLIESELFGYRAGAFTGAQREGRRGKIVQANGGTLFLDEIGDMPLALQARLLRVIEEHEVTPLGTETTVKVNFQLISASHRNLLELVHSGEFREDLYYRLKGVELNLPALRDRLDKLPLIHHLLAIETDDPPELTPEAEHALLTYDWPGNIRQLRHVLQMGVALSDGQPIRCEDLPPEITQRAPATDIPTALRLATADMDTHAADDADLSALNAIQLNERETVLSLLDEHRWNVSNVAKALGISRNTLYRKMRRLHIRLSHEGSPSDGMPLDLDA